MKPLSFSVDTMNRLMKNHSFLRQIRPLYTCCTMAVNLVQLSLWKFVWDLLLWVPFWKKYIYMVASKYDCIADTCWNIILYCRKTVKTTVLLASLSPRGRTVDREVHVQELELRPTTGFRQDSNHFQTFDKYSIYLFSEVLWYTCICFIVDNSILSVMINLGFWY